MSGQIASAGSYNERSFGATATVKVTSTEIHPWKCLFWAFKRILTVCQHCGNASHRDTMRIELLPHLDRQDQFNIQPRLWK